MHNAQKTIFNLGWFFSAYVNNHSAFSGGNSPQFYTFPMLTGIPTLSTLCGNHPSM